MLRHARNVATADTAVTCVLVLALVFTTLSYYAADDALKAMEQMAREEGRSLAATGPVRASVAASLIALVSVLLCLMVVARARLADGGWFGASRVAALKAAATTTTNTTTTTTNKTK